jgi:hypothetical protein
MMIATCLGVVPSSLEGTTGSLTDNLSYEEFWDDERGETVTRGSK